MWSRQAKRVPCTRMIAAEMVKRYMSFKRVRMNLQDLLNDLLRFLT